MGVNTRILKKTITTILCVPTLGIKSELLNDNGFINGYSKDLQQDIEYKDSVYLLFQPKNLNQFREFLEDEYERTKQIIEDYDLAKGFVVVVYKLDPLYKVDFDLIRKSKYSKTSPGFQNLFPRIKKMKLNGLMKDEISLQYRIFNRTQDLITFWEDKFGITLEKEQEVWSGFIEENECLGVNSTKEITE